MEETKFVAIMNHELYGVNDGSGRLFVLQPFWICQFCSTASKLSCVVMDLLMNRAVGADPSGTGTASHSSGGSGLQALQAIPFGRSPESLMSSTPTKICEGCKLAYEAIDDFAPADSGVVIRWPKTKLNLKTGKREPHGSECLACQAQTLKQSC